LENKQVIHTTNLRELLLREAQCVKGLIKEESSNYCTRQSVPKPPSYDDGHIHSGTCNVAIEKKKSA
jgi:hypothetical protein